MNSFRLLWVVVTLLFLRPVTAAAQSAQTWGELRLPGGLAAARQLVDTGTIGGRSDARWLVDVVRRVQGPVESTERIDLLGAYLKYVEGAGPVGSVVSRTVPARAAVGAFSGTQQGSPSHRDARLGANGRRPRVELGSMDDARQKQAWLGLLGVNAAALVNALNTKAPVHIKVVDGRLPLPLPDYFRSAIFRPGASDVMAIVGNRKVAWFYAALMSCDELTLRVLVTNPALLRQIQQSSASFVVAGRTLRLRPARVETPGDSGAVAAWEALVGRKVTDVYFFARDLLARDSGRLAYFYSVRKRNWMKRGRLLCWANTLRRRTGFVLSIGYYRQFLPLDFGWVLKPRRSFDRTSIHSWRSRWWT